MAGSARSWKVQSYLSNKVDPNDNNESSTADAESHRRLENTFRGVSSWIPFPPVHPRHGIELLQRSSMEIRRIAAGFQSKCHRWHLAYITLVDSIYHAACNLWFMRAVILCLQWEKSMDRKVFTIHEWKNSLKSHSLMLYYPADLWGTPAYPVLWGAMRA